MTAGTEGQRASHLVFIVQIRFVQHVDAPMQSGGTCMCLSGPYAKHTFGPASGAGALPSAAAWSNGLFRTMWHTMASRASALHACMQRCQHLSSQCTR